MEIEENVSLTDLGTLRVGGMAKFFCIVESVVELKEALAFTKEKDIPLVILGGGSNMYFSDEGYEGLVVAMRIRRMAFQEWVTSTLVSVGAGENWDHFVESMVEKGFCGLENLSYIPGTVGACPIQNIGAYGVEVKDVIVKVKTIDIRTGEEKIFLNEACHFAYRDSFFKTEEGRNFIIFEVQFQFRKEASVDISYKDFRNYFQENDRPTPEEVRRSVIEIRKNKLPDPKVIGTLGSFFKNPVVQTKTLVSLQNRFPNLLGHPFSRGYSKLSAAWVIDHVCGLKGYRVGDVGVYQKQPLAVVNYGNAKAADVQAFVGEIKKKVEEETGIILEDEVRFVR